MTQTGAVIGTPEYMSPEQARGQRDLGPSADIFALGCVLFECLIGEPPFVAEHLAAVLAKILFEEPPSLQERSSRIPSALAELVSRMLAKDPKQRPATAAVLLDALAKLGDATERVLDSGSATLSAGIFGGEQRLVSVVVAAPVVELADEVTLDPGESEPQQALLESLRAALAGYGAHTERLADGSLVAALSPAGGAATDQAVQGARCALVIKERWPQSCVVLATGLGVLNERLPVGEVLDRAGQLIRVCRQEAAGAVEELIALDEVTAGLIAARFPVRRGGADHFWLHGEELGADASQTLLGRPTPCVGRDQDIEILAGALRVCREESVVQAVLVTGAPGMGKSRLLHELLRRVQPQQNDMLLLLGRGDPMSAGSSCGVLGQAICRLCGVSSSEPLAERKSKLRERISRYLDPVPDPALPQRVIEFIGEVCSVPFADEASAKLRAARQDPRIMADQLGLALTEFLRAECQVQPVLLVLEDLHWGDALTIKLIDIALRALREQPFMVLALARPEIHELFPNMWAGRMQQIQLRGLSRKAQERLVRQILGDTIGAVTLARIVEQSEGNALLLEELIRAVADGKGDDLPVTVMAMLQSRIGALDAAARKLLRAASVFGATFWLGGIRALLAGERQTGDLLDCLNGLVRSEVLELRRDSRFPADPEYRFRHALMREAAYSLLTDEDRARSHRIAGEYLERQGETDPVILAEHAYRSGEKQQAIPHFVRAAERALDGNDLTAALLRTKQGVQCDAQGEQLGALLTLQSAAHLWRGELEAAYDISTTALALLPEGGTRWCKAMLTLFFVTTYLGKREQFSGLVARFRAVSPEPQARASYTEAAAWLVMMSSFLGKRTLGRSFLDHMYRISAALADTDPSIHGWVKLSHSIFCHWVENDLWLKQTLAREAIAAAEQAGNRRMIGFATLALGLGQIYMGDFATGFATLRSVLSLIKNLPDESILAGTTMGFYALALTEEDAARHQQEARALAAACFAQLPPTAPAAAMAHISLARILAAEASFAEAELHARKAISILRVEPVCCLVGYAALVKILQQQDKKIEARSEAESGLAMLASLDGNTSTELELRLALAEARQADGDPRGAEQALREALGVLRLGMEKIPGPALRTRYLDRVPTHARVLHLAQKWFGASAAELGLGV